MSAERDCGRWLGLALLSLGLLACDGSPAAPAAEPAPAPAPSDEPPRPLSPLAGKGKSLFLARCAGCHGKEGDGVGIAAKVLVPRPRDFTRGIFKFGSTLPRQLPSDADLKRVVTERLYWSSMHPDTNFTEEDLEAVVAYTKAMSRHRDEKTGKWIYHFDDPREPLEVPPEPEPSATTLAEGKRLYETSCATCHGATGKGDGLAAPGIHDYWGEKLDPRDLQIPIYKVGASTRDVFIVVSRGIPGTPMPPMLHLPADQRWAISQYVVSLQRWPKQAVARGEVLYRAYGCASCHGPEGDAEIPNNNSVRKTVPSLAGMAERLFLYENEDIDAFLQCVEDHGDPRAVEDHPDVPRWSAVMAQYGSVIDVINNGATSGKADANGENPPMDMPRWGHKLKPGHVEALVCYLVSLGREDEEE